MSDITISGQFHDVAAAPRPRLTIARPILPSLRVMAQQTFRLGCGTALATALLVPDSVVIAKMFKAKMAAHNVVSRHLRSR